MAWRACARSIYDSLRPLRTNIAANTSADATIRPSTNILDFDETGGVGTGVGIGVSDGKSVAVNVGRMVAVGVADSVGGAGVGVSFCCMNNLLPGYISCTAVKLFHLRSSATFTP